jgi:hypothetical protein
MRKYKKVKKEVKELDKVFCNFCEKDITDDEMIFNGGHIEVSFTWLSEFECMRFDGDICDDCFKTIFKGKLRLECDGQHFVCHGDPCIEE